MRGMERREIASDAETARRGGRAAEKTKEGELMRYCGSKVNEREQRGEKGKRT